MPSDPSLRRWYRRFNDRWFGGTLPDDMDVFWEPANGSLGETFEVILPEAEAREVSIRLDPTLRFSSRMAQFTLLHEMVHCEMYQKHGPKGLNHGKRFTDRMRQLAAQGTFDALW